MKSCWIVIVCPFCLLLNAPSSTALDWSSEYLLSSVANREKEFMDTVYKSSSRQKRAAPVPSQEYVADIEISSYDPAFLELLKVFIKELDVAKTFNTSETLNISSIAVTTTCSVNASTVKCSCESGYDWNSNMCSANPSCFRTPQSCDCSNTFPAEGAYCQPDTPTHPVSINMELKILEDFSNDLTNTSSEKYIQYKGELETAFSNSYLSLPGFQSVAITGFRKGSVIVDYIIIAESPTKDEIDKANMDVVTNLNGSFPLPPSPFTTYIYDQTNFTTSTDVLFEGDTLIMTCTTKSNSTSMTWTPNTPKSNTTLNNGYSITVANITNISSAASGEYTCQLNDTTVIYIGKHNVSVLSAIVNSSASSYILCDGSKFVIYQWCTSGSVANLNCNCTRNGSLDIPVSPEGNMSNNCFTFSLTVAESSCPPEKSGNQSIYTCDCKTANRVIISSKTTVTFIRKATVTITGNATISVGDNLELKCNSNVNKYETITWNLTTKGGQILTNTLLLRYQDTSSTLNIGTAVLDWEGIYTCCVLQKISSSCNSITINITPLPFQNQITIDPIEKTVLSTTTVTLNCRVTDNNNYKIQFTNKASIIGEILQASQFSKNYTPTPGSTGKILIYCEVSNNLRSIQQGPITLNIIPAITVSCPGTGGLGVGQEGNTESIACQSPLAGTITYLCSKGSWVKNTNSCISAQLNDRLQESQILQYKPVSEIPTFLSNLTSTVSKEQNDIASSFQSIKTIIGILDTVAKINVTVKEGMMSDFLNTANVIVTNENAWKSVNESDQNKDSSLLLLSTENFSRQLKIENGSINKTTENIILKGIVVESGTGNYSVNFSFANASNLFGNVFIRQEMLHQSIAANSNVITIAYSTLNKIMKGTSDQVVNGLVMSTIVSYQPTELTNFSISMAFQKINSSLTNPKCVFWNFSLNNASGDWDGSGCHTSYEQENVVCTCDHLTSFSNLMSSPLPNDGPQVGPTLSPKQRDALDKITYIGVGVSIGSLLVCIIIEALVWKSVTKNKTAYMRHVCLVNIAVSLMIADIWFIIGANMEERIQQAKTTNTTTSIVDACDAVTFFTHLFYLSLFFWMLTMGLILFYRMVYIFSDISRTAMLAIAFSLGYGCPLVISFITVAVTRPSNNYREDMNCWLNMTPSKAFIAFVLPALTIIAANFIILVVVIVKLLRPSIGDKARKEERSTLVKIAKSVAILTPLLGLTWGLGIGTIFSNTFAMQVAFSALNSFQGFFILLFGTLTDVKIREALLHRFALSRWTSQLTKSTTLSSSSRPTPSKPKINIFGKRGGYNLSSALESSSIEASTNSYSVLQ